MTTQSNVETLRKEVLEKIGRNLLMFQEAEQILKMALRFMINSKTNQLALELSEEQNIFSSKLTLGYLAKYLQDCLTTDEPGLFTKLLKDFVDNRNNLVHHFFERSDCKMSTEFECKTAIQYLDEQHEAARPTMSIFKAQILGISLMLNEHSDNSEI